MSATLLSEIVHFDLTDATLAQRLCTHLGKTRLAWVEPSVDDSLLVGAVLDSDRNDLALLLRNVEAWLGELALGPIPFEIDGRTYALRPRVPLSRQAA